MIKWIRTSRFSIKNSLSGLALLGFEHRCLLLVCVERRGNNSKGWLICSRIWPGLAYLSDSGRYKGGKRGANLGFGLVLLGLEHLCLLVV